jgi:hypothetical protein
MLTELDDANGWALPGFLTGTNQACRLDADAVMQHPYFNEAGFKSVVGDYAPMRPVFRFDDEFEGDHRTTDQWYARCAAEVELFRSKYVQDEATRDGSSVASNGSSAGSGHESEGLGVGGSAPKRRRLSNSKLDEFDAVSFDLQLHVAGVGGARAEAGVGTGAGAGQDRLITVRFHRGMGHIACKAAILAALVAAGAAEEHQHQIDEVAVAVAYHDGTKIRIPCTIEDLEAKGLRVCRNEDSRGHPANIGDGAAAGAGALAPHGTAPAPAPAPAHTPPKLTLQTSLSPVDRGLERADWYHQTPLKELHALLGITSYNERRLIVAEHSALLAVPEIRWHLRESGWRVHPSQTQWILPDNAPTETLRDRCTAVIACAKRVTFLPPAQIFDAAIQTALAESAPYNPDLVGQQLEGTVVSKRWELTKHLYAGTFGRGFVAKDVVTGTVGFVKSFRSFTDKDDPQDVPAATRHDYQAWVDRANETVRKEVAVMRDLRYREMSAHASVMRYNLCYGEMVVGSSCSFFFFLGSVDHISSPYT